MRSWSPLLLLDLQPGIALLIAIPAAAAAAAAAYTWQTNVEARQEALLTETLPNNAKLNLQKLPSSSRCCKSFAVHLQSCRIRPVLRFL
jgi:hypothetical protein